MFADIPYPPKAHGISRLHSEARVPRRICTVLSAEPTARPAPSARQRPAKESICISHDCHALQPHAAKRRGAYRQLFPPRAHTGSQSYASCASFSVPHSRLEMALPAEHTAQPTQHNEPHAEVCPPHIRSHTYESCIMPTISPGAHIHAEDLESPASRFAAQDRRLLSCWLHRCHTPRVRGRRIYPSDVCQTDREHRSRHSGTGHTHACYEHGRRLKSHVKCSKHTVPAVEPVHHTRPELLPIEA